MRLITRALAALLLVVALAGCTPGQVQGWLAARGVQVNGQQATDIANIGADHQARTNGRAGTCTETGIFYAESGGNWRAENPRSSASGGYQFIDGTWAGHRGYGHASWAPPWAQRERFHQIWRGGAGRGHWAASVC